jgi:DNA-directed RNA polymerase subunit RPC12/RpoP
MLYPDECSICKKKIDIYVDRWYIRRVAVNPTRYECPICGKCIRIFYKPESGTYEILDLCDCKMIPHSILEAAKNAPALSTSDIALCGECGDKLLGKLFTAIKM